MKFILEGEEFNTGNDTDDVSVFPDVSYIDGDRMPAFSKNSIKDVFYPSSDVSTVETNNHTENKEQAVTEPETSLKMDLTDTGDYSEIADQLYNLVNNRKSAENKFKAILKTGDEEELEKWFNDNVKPDELSDLLDSDQTISGFISWILLHPGYFLANTEEAEMTSPDSSSPVTDASSKAEDIQKSIAGQQSSIGDEDASLIMVPSDDDDTSDEDDREGSDEDAADTDISSHVRVVKRRHILNKVVLKINNDEAADRLCHEKYYILKKGNIGNFSNLDELEGKLDKKNISYYDFKNCSCKIYDSNEVELNRIFESMDLDVRCINIRHYTENEIRSNKEKAKKTREEKNIRKQNTVSAKSKKTTTTIYYMDNQSFKHYVQLVQNMQYYYLPFKFTVSIENSPAGSTLSVSVTFAKKQKAEKRGTKAHSYSDDISSTDTEEKGENMISRLKNALSGSAILTR